MKNKFFFLYGSSTERYWTWLDILSNCAETGRGSRQRKKLMLATPWNWYAHVRSKEHVNNDHKAVIYTSNILQVGFIVWDVLQVIHLHQTGIKLRSYLTGWSAKLLSISENALEILLVDWRRAQSFFLHACPFSINIDLFCVGETL